ncbi:17917_t:CDS:2 [Entrophospora sp. SA101]|nr:17917_t:CDS:2 [Entrophospora sp. SA101]
MSERKKKISSLPPLPTEFLQLYSDNKVHIDNPDEHQGRVRTKLHVEGNWATHVYMEVIIPEDFEDLLKNIKIQSESFLNNNEKEIKVFSCLEEEESELLKLLDKDVLNIKLHISLTKPIFLKYFQINGFWDNLKKGFKNKKKFEIAFSKLQNLTNNENTRSFLALEVDKGFDKCGKRL